MIEQQRTMSYEAIYRRVRADRKRGGRLWTHMRHMSKAFRKRKGSPATRGRLVGKRHISERPAAVELRQEVGHCEGDTVMGADQRHCVLTLVERATGFLQMKKLISRTKEQAGAALAQCIIKLHGVIKSITLDNGTEFHDYKSVEEAVSACRSTTRHPTTRGSEAPTEHQGLIRQYLPKGKCLKDLSRPTAMQSPTSSTTAARKTRFRTPACALAAQRVLHFKLNSACP